MENEWIEPKIASGGVAKGDEYYPRPELEEKIIYQLKKGSNVLLKGPRRVGKTSVLFYLCDQSINGYRIVFENIQGVTSEKGFYKKLYNLIMICLSKFETNKKLIEDYFKKINVKKISWSGGIEIETKDIDYIQEINAIIPKLNTRGETIVLFIDELPEVLYNLYKTDKVDQANAILKNLRRWEQQSDFEKLQFVFAGSVGMRFVTQKITGRTSDVNALSDISYQPLSQEEALHYISWATRGATIQYDTPLKKHLLSKIQYYVPYFINLFLEEIHVLAKRNNIRKINDEHINTAFESIIKNKSKLEDWIHRLSDYLTKEEFAFVNEILTHIAHKDTIRIQTIYDKAVAHERTNDYMYFIDELEEAGYITETAQTYVFISPLLQAYWKRMNPIYHG